MLCIITPPPPLKSNALLEKNQQPLGLVEGGSDRANQIELFCLASPSHFTPALTAE
jgi:hypothetical protein